MADKTGIEWTDATWNPVTGCTKVSEGCDHCYAETIAHRFAGTKAYPNGFDVTLRPERLEQPLRWKRPRRIFVNSMSDLFHSDVPDDYIAQVFEVMTKAQQHTFQVLTKRPGRMRSLLSRRSFRDNFAHWGQPWPLPNVWLGTSVETQRWADVRIPLLLDTPAAVRFLSCEPLLGPIDLNHWIGHTPECLGSDDPPWCTCPWEGRTREPYFYKDKIHWVICGGESGHGARPMHPDWARSLRDQCQATTVPFHFKQWGEWAPAGYSDGTHLLQVTGQAVTRESGTVTNPYGYGSGVQDLVDRGHAGWVRIRRVGKRAAGRELDGRTWDEYPGGLTDG